MKYELANKIIENHLNKTILVSSADDNIYANLIENNQLIEIASFDSNNSFNTDDIILGKIDRIDKGLNAAFVNIGDKQNAFLSLTEKMSYMKIINNILKSGENIIVQIISPSFDSKGARVTRDIKIPGNLVMLMPYNTFIGISNRIKNEKNRARLKSIGESISKNKFGIVFRKLAENAKIEDIEYEINIQYSIYMQIEEIYKNIKAPYCLLKANYSLQDYIYDIKKTSEIVDVLCNDMQIVNYYLKEPSFNIKYDDTINVTTQQKKSKTKIISKLLDGSQIVIDFCEALTVVDINTSQTCYADKQTTFLSINLFATEEIVKQIRLNNICGIIIIDYLKMDSDDDYSIVSNTLIKLLCNDRIKTVVHGFTKLGLMELTRKRTNRG